MSDDKKLVLIDFKRKEKEPPIVNDNIVRITYVSGKEEVIHADAFAIAAELPGFITLWKEDPYKLLGFINISNILKMSIEKKDDGI